MAFENKILRIIAGITTRKKMAAFFKYLKNKDIKLTDQQKRSALNKLSMLPDDTNATT